jgi:phosphate transport system ATP-binding protein
MSPSPSSSPSPSPTPRVPASRAAAAAPAAPAHPRSGATPPPPPVGHTSPAQPTAARGSEPAQPGSGWTQTANHGALAALNTTSTAAEKRDPGTGAPTRLTVDALTAFFGATPAVKDITLELPDRFVTAIIGPSGCGKSTLLRCLNRMHETVPSARVTGQVLLDGRNIYNRDVNVTAVRQHIGMVFQRPTPFPTMSIRDNVAAGLSTLSRMPSHARVDEIVEKALRRAALWDEVKDRLRDGATGLSGGQQQRLCIARALAIEPEVLLLDEPTASLDPISTQKVEDLVYELRRDMTVVIVTHNMQQAARVSDRTAFMLHGDLVEVAPTRALFTTPKNPHTEAYITGRFG